MIIRQWQEPWETDPNQQIDYLEVLLNIRHGAYSFSDGDLTVITFAPDEDYDEDPAYHIEKGYRPMRTIPESHRKDFLAAHDDDLTWGTVLLVTGVLHDHSYAFQELAARLLPSLDPAGMRPSGDDDYFDYWPGGMETLRDYAIDLDHAYTHYWAADHYQDPGFLGVYHHVLTDFLVRECRTRNTDQPDGWLWEHVPDLINELAEDTKKSYADTLAMIQRKAAA